MPCASAGMETGGRQLLPASRLDLPPPACRGERRDRDFPAQACVRGYGINRPGGTRGPDEGRREMVWSALFLLAALVGGFAAADLAHVSTIRAGIVSVLIAAAVTLVAHYGLSRSDRSDAPPMGQKPRPPRVERRGIQAPSGRRPDSSIRAAPDEVAVVRLMQQEAGRHVLVESRRTRVGRRCGGSGTSPGHSGSVELPRLGAGRPVPELWLVPHGHRPDGTGMALPLPGMPAGLGLAAWRSLARDPGSAAVAQGTIEGIRCIRNRSAVRGQVALSFCWTAQIP